MRPTPTTPSQNSIRMVEIVGDNEGGGTNFVMNLVDTLDPARFTTTVVAPEADWIAERCARAGAIYAPLPLKRSRLSRHVRQQLGQILQASTPDIVHAHGTRAGWYARACLPSDEYRGAFFYSEHAFAFDARKGPARLPWLAIERAICRRADLVLLGCPLNARRIVSKGWVAPERIGCDRAGYPAANVRRWMAAAVPREAMGVPAGALLVGSVGRLIPQKGWRYLLDAFAEVARACPAAYLIIVGDGEERQAMEARVRAQGLANRVRFVGAQFNPWSWLAHCDVIALHSLWEGEWITPLEAMEARLPLVVARVGGAVDYIDDGQNGLMVPSKDAHAMAEAILSLLRDPAKRAAMRAAPRPILAEYDVAVVHAKIGTLYEQAASRREPLIAR